MSRFAIVGSLLLGLVLGSLLLIGRSAVADRSEGMSLSLYQTRMPAGSPFSGYSYANFNGVDFRDFAIASDVRRIQLKQGPNEVALEGIPESIDWATLSLRSRTDPVGTRLVEQQVAPVSKKGHERILDEARGKEVSIQTKSRNIRGILTSVDSAYLVLKTADKEFPTQLIRMGAVLGIQVSGPPTNLDRSPMRVTIEAAKAGLHEIELTYRMHKMSWKVDYTAIYEPGRELIDLSGHASVRNKSSSAFGNARVELVHRLLVVENQNFGTIARIDNSPETVRRFQLPGRISSPAEHAVQVELFPRLFNQPVKKVSVFEAVGPVAYAGYPNTDCSAHSIQGPRKKMSDYLEIEAKRLGAKSVPPGNSRLFRRRGNEPLELISDEKVHLGFGQNSLRFKIGENKSLEATRKQLDCRHDERARTVREKVEVTVKNKSKRVADVIVREYMSRWPSWTVESESSAGTLVSRNSREYRIRSIAAGKSTSLTYTVLYSW